MHVPSAAADSQPAVADQYFCSLRSFCIRCDSLRTVKAGGRSDTDQSVLPIASGAEQSSRISGCMQASIMTSHPSTLKAMRNSTPLLT